MLPVQSLLPGQLPPSPPQHPGAGPDAVALKPRQPGTVRGGLQTPRSARRALHRQSSKDTWSFHFNTLFQRRERFSRPLVSNVTFAAGVHLLEDVCKSLSQLSQTSLCINGKKKVLLRPKAASLTQRVRAFFLLEGPLSVPPVWASRVFYGEAFGAIMSLPCTASGHNTPAGLHPKTVYRVRAGKC